MKYGGCISHHHGVGKLRKKFLPNSIGNTGLDILKGVKATIDPKNIFATGNLIHWLFIEELNAKLKKKI